MTSLRTRTSETRPKTAGRRAFGCLARLSVVFGMLYIVAAWWFPEQRSPNADFFSGTEFDLVAHRGGAGQFPENTLPAFLNARAVGANLLEMDLRTTRDGVVVLIHDATVDRTTNGVGPVGEMSLKELQDLDAGYRFSNETGEHPFRGRGIRVPTLEQILIEFPEMRLNMEFKERSPATIDTTCELLEKHGARQRALIGSFHHQSLEMMRERCPTVATSLSFREGLIYYYLYKAGLARLFRSKAVALQIPERFRGDVVVTEDFVSTVHRQNRRLHVWTVNEPEAMTSLIRRGVDGILTDYPNRLERVLTADSSRLGEAAAATDPP